MLSRVSITKMFPANRPIKFLHTRQKTEVSFGSTDPAGSPDSYCHGFTPAQAQGNLDRSLPCPGSHVQCTQCQGKGVLPGSQGGGTGRQVPPAESTPTARWDCREANEITSSPSTERSWVWPNRPGPCSPHCFQVFWVLSTPL